MTISCLIPAYNAEAYLGEAIESALNQTRRPDEVVIIDDGSTDNTAAVAGCYPVRVVTQPNGGIVAARNRAIAEAEGELVAWLDADDIWMPDHLARLEPILGDHVVAFGDGVRLFPDGPETETYIDRSKLRDHYDVSSTAPTVLDDRLYKALIPGLFVQNGFMLFRKRDGIRAGLYDPTQSTSEDRLFMISLCLLGTAIFDPHIHCHVRLHPDSATAPGKHLDVARERLKALDKIETMIARRSDDEDRRELARLRQVEHLRLRRLASEQGLRNYIGVPGALTHPRDLVRAVVKSF